MGSTRSVGLGTPGLVLPALLLLACDGPIGPLPGGRLGGEVVEQPVTDWSFSDAYEEIEVETRPGDPYSVTVWCAVLDGRLYVPSRNPEEKAWIRYVLEDPRVRVRVGEKVYPARAVRVRDRQEIERVIPHLVEKYDLDPPGDDERQDVWLFRLDSRGERGEAAS